MIQSLGLQVKEKFLAENPKKLFSTLFPAVMLMPCMEALESYPKRIIWPVTGGNFCPLARNNILFLHSED